MLSGADSRTRIYFYLFRRAPRFDPGELGEQSTVAAISQRRRRSFLSRRVQDIQTYIAWTYDPHLSSASKGRSNQAWWKSYLQNWLARRRNPHESVYLLTEIEAAATRFRQLVDASCALVSDLTPLELLDAKAGSGVLSELINRPGRPGGGWEGATGSGMNWRLARSELEAERRHLRLDGEPVILYSLLSPPGGARANLLNDLYRLDATMTVAMEWRPWGLDSARRKIRGAQRHYFSKRYSMMAHMQETEGTSSAMVDSAAEAESSRLGNALVELETEGIAYGDLALTISLHGDLEQTERLDGDIHRIFASHDAKAIREGYGQLATWFCRLPAQPRKRQVRSVFVSAGAAACMAPIFGPPSGNPRSAHLRRDALAILETQWRTPYYYDLFHGDVGHTLILGATGAGKSFTLNFLLVQALQYDPRVLILDLGGSYRWLTRFLGGGYLELSPDNPDGSEGFRLRPFSLPAGERTYQFLTGWITRLLRIGGWQVSGEDPSEIRARIEDLYAFGPERRTLGVLVRSLPSKMWPALGRWHGEGAWGKYFDNPAGETDLELADWQVIDLAGAAEHEDLCEAALVLSAGADAAGAGKSSRDGEGKAHGGGRSLEILARSGGAELSGRGRQDLEEEERGLDYGDAKRRGRDRHRRSRGVARIHADQAFPCQPGAAGQGSRHLSPESVRGGHHTRFDSEARAVSAAAGGCRQASTRSGPGKLLALYLIAPRRPGAGGGGRTARPGGRTRILVKPTEVAP